MSDSTRAIILMKTPVKIVIVLLVLAAAVAAIVLKQNKEGKSETKRAPSETTGRAVPRLLDLGATQCIPCKMMAPILEELKSEYSGRMTVQFIDVWENPAAAEQHKIEGIPTQIFFDAEGKELFRHAGFIGKEDILNKWKELGIDLHGKPEARIVRETPVNANSRSRETVCAMCDGDIGPKTKVVVRGQSEQRFLCSPHCCMSSFPSTGHRAPDAKPASA